LSLKEKKNEWLPSKGRNNGRTKDTNERVGVGTKRKRTEGNKETRNKSKKGVADE
jgi:hypothetical protein